jgi:hypothetical protein
MRPAGEDVKRRIVTVVLLSMIVALSLPGCSGTPTAQASAAQASAAQASAAQASATRQATAAWWGFTVSGVHPVAANGSQDTQAQAGGAACANGQLAVDAALGGQIVSGFTAASFPVAAQLLKHFLAGSGTAVNYPASSQIAKLALASVPFATVRGEVTAAIMRQLAAGRKTVRLDAAQLPLATFSSTSSDLYWGFRGTQGLTVTGSGIRKDGKYVGALTYVIRDSYGFPVGDTLDGFGPPMRYLQTVCGAPQHPGGAHWFPDSITVTMPFNQPA